MANSLIMMATTTNSPVVANGIIPLTTITRRRGQVLTSSLNNVLLTRPGYYKVNGSITFTAQAAGVASVQLQKNDVDIVGVSAATTITTATTEVRTLNISGIVRVICSEGLATLTLVNSGVAITTSNVELDVEYLG